MATKELIRALLEVFESGPVSHGQRLAILRVRVLLGDAKGAACLHDQGDFRDADDVLRCVLCHEDLEAEPANQRTRSPHPPTTRPRRTTRNLAATTALGGTNAQPAPP